MNFSPPYSFYIVILDFTIRAIYNPNRESKMIFWNFLDEELVTKSNQNLMEYEKSSLWVVLQESSQGQH